MSADFLPEEETSGLSIATGQLGGGGEWRGSGGIETGNGDRGRREGIETGEEWGNRGRE